MFGDSKRKESNRRLTKQQEIAFSRDGGRCHYCNVGGAMTIDHVVPRSMGGGNSADNIVLACKSCNSSKGPKTYQEFLEFVEAEMLAFETHLSMADCL